MKSLVSQTVMAVSLLLIIVSPGLCDVTLPDVFGSNMVLQRNMEVPLWGTADPGEKVSIVFNGTQASTTTGGDGLWKLRLKKMQAGGPCEMFITGKNTVAFTNVMVGEVWFCSGQSNMWWPVGRLHDIPPEVAPADNPDIRLYSLWSPEHDSYGKRPEWVPCGTEALEEFSAAAYFFGRYIQKELNVPVGLIHSSMGGSIPEAWMTRKTLESDPEFRPIIASWDSVIALYPNSLSRFNNYMLELKAAKAQGTALPEKPVFKFVPKPLRIYMRYPQGIYDAQLVPVMPYGIKGIIWFQGEASIGRAYQYRRLFPAMIREWRNDWGQGDFPFLYVQLANYGGGPGLPELREAQMMSLSVPNTAMAVTIDIGDDNDVHANNKWDVGYRLALAALNRVYGRDNVYSGPIYESMRSEGSTVRLKFRHVADGLTAHGGESLKGFTIAGNDRTFHEAEARIEDKEVIVTCSQVTHPVAVRYAWESTPVCNLYNSAGLPASPFRTDDWPGVTEGILRPY